MLSVGTKAPDFSLYDRNGILHNLSDYTNRGQKILLYFYPKDNTAGCTKQAVGYTKLQKIFEEKGITIIGISKDSISSHKNFADKQKLTITLLSDLDKTTIEAYDVWKEKKLYGKISFGVVRTTYLIDEHGIIIYANDKVKAADDATCMIDLHCVGNKKTTV